MNLIGQRVGSYLVERELGSGGTGVVYLCRHTMIDREVAVKVLHDDLARDPDQVARFFQEAKAAADIGHPNIIVIIDYGTLDTGDGPRTYLMMESLDGQSLDKRLRTGGLALDQIAHVLQQIASALVACHGKGIVHRDLKPSNVYLCNRTFDPLFVKVLDFGTAKLAAPAPGVRKTQYGMVIGTPAYMSPEQCEGKGALDHRSDIYSLGVMLYEMLTGALPYDGELKEMLVGHMTGTPTRPRERNPSIPVEWEALCERMMEKSREARFQSVTELARALEDLRGHAAAYEQFRAQRARTGHSGTTMVAGGEERPTIHATLAGLAGGEARPTLEPEPFRAGGEERPTLEPDQFRDGRSGSAGGEGRPTIHATPVAPIVQSFDPRTACHALAAEPRHAAFPRTLMTRPAGTWFEVGELCRTAGVAQPAALPPEDGLWAAWIAHPYPDPNLAAVVFLALRTGWSHVVLCERVR